MYLNLQNPDGNTFGIPRLSVFDPLRTSLKAARAALAAPSSSWRRGKGGFLPVSRHGCLPPSSTRPPPPVFCWPPLAGPRSRRMCSRWITFCCSSRNFLFTQGRNCPTMKPWEIGGLVHESSKNWHIHRRKNIKWVKEIHPRTDSCFSGRDICC